MLWLRLRHNFVDVQKISEGQAWSWKSWLQIGPAWAQVLFQMFQTVGQASGVGFPGRLYYFKHFHKKTKDNKQTKNAKKNKS